MQHHHEWLGSNVKIVCNVMLWKDGQQTDGLTDQHSSVESHVRN